MLLFPSRRIKIILFFWCKKGKKAAESVLIPSIGGKHF
jgi:hypothetical protein